MRVPYGTNPVSPEVKASSVFPNGSSVEIFSSKIPETKILRSPQEKAVVEKWTSKDKVIAGIRQDLAIETLKYEFKGHVMEIIDIAKLPSEPFAKAISENNPEALEMPHDKALSSKQKEIYKKLSSLVERGITARQSTLLPAA